MECKWVRRKVLASTLGITIDKTYDLQEKWLPGVHKTQINARMFWFNLPLIEDWLANQHDPAAHQRAIDLYLAELPGNQRRPVGRPRKEVAAK